MDSEYEAGLREHLAERGKTPKQVDAHILKVKASLMSEAELDRLGRTLESTMTFHPTEGRGDWKIPKPRPLSRSFNRQEYSLVGIASSALTRDEQIITSTEIANRIRLMGYNARIVKWAKNVGVYATNPVNFRNELWGRSRANSNASTTAQVMRVAANAAPTERHQWSPVVYRKILNREEAHDIEAARRIPDFNALNEPLGMDYAEAVSELVGIGDLEFITRGEQRNVFRRADGMIVKVNRHTDEVGVEPGQYHGPALKPGELAGERDPAPFWEDAVYAYAEQHHPWLTKYLVPAEPGGAQGVVVMPAVQVVGSWSTAEQDFLEQRLPGVHRFGPFRNEHGNFNDAKWDEALANFSNTLREEAELHGQGEVWSDWWLEQDHGPGNFAVITDSNAYGLENDYPELQILDYYAVSYNFDGGVSRMKLEDGRWVSPDADTHQATSISELPTYEGEAWRTPSGFWHDKGTTAADVIRFEREELGNIDTFSGISDELLDELDQYDADDIIWVARDEATAADYNTGNRTGREAVAGGSIFHEDTDGVLVLKPGALKRYAKSPKEQDTKENPYRRGYNIHISGHRGAWLEHSHGHSHYDPQEAFSTLPGHRHEHDGGKTASEKAKRKKRSFNVKKPPKPPQIGAPRMNRMGTVSLDIQGRRMRKSQKFTFYPKSAADDLPPAVFHIQSSTRNGFIDLETGKIFTTPPYPGGSYSHHLGFHMGSEIYGGGENTMRYLGQLTEDDRLAVVDAVGNTTNVFTEGIIKSDNSGADAMWRKALEESEQ